MNFDNNKNLFTKLNTIKECLIDYVGPILIFGNIDFYLLVALCVEDVADASAWFNL